MKKANIILLLALFIMAPIFLNACGKTEEESLNSKVESKTIAYKTDLEDSLDSFKDNASIKEYLTHWAKTKSVPYTVDKYNNIIMTVAANEYYSEAAPTIIVTDYDVKNIKKSINQITTALYLAKNNENTGDLTVIFTSSEGNDFSGIKGLSPSYFPDDANVFCLTDGIKQRWSFQTAAMSSYEFTGHLKYTKPTGDKAYTISISGLSGGKPDGNINSYPNPIKELTSLLAYFKTNAMIYELASISGGNSGNLSPQNASMTIVVKDEYAEKFKHKIESTMHSFNDDNKSDHPGAAMSYTQVSVPDKVFTEDSLNNFISSQYTLMDGVYNRDKDDNVDAITNIGYISTDDEKYTILASAYALSSKQLKKIDDDFITICGISGLSYKKVYTHDNWDAQKTKKKNFTSSIDKAFDDYTGYDMEYFPVIECSNASFIKSKNPKCNVVVISYGAEKVERYAGTIITFMINQPHTEKSQS